MRSKVFVQSLCNVYFERYAANKLTWPKYGTLSYLTLVMKCFNAYIILTILHNVIRNMTLHVAMYIYNTHPIQVRTVTVIVPPRSFV